MSACGHSVEDLKSITAQLIRVREGLDAAAARAAAAADDSAAA